MIKIIKSKYNVGDTATWAAPYGFESVTISEVDFDNAQGCYKYKTQEYTFWIYEREL